MQKCYIHRYGFLWFTISYIEDILLYHLGNLEIYHKDRLDRLVKNLTEEEIKEIIETSNLVEEEEKEIAHALLNCTYTDEFNKNLFKQASVKMLKSFGIDISKLVYDNNK